MQPSSPSSRSAAPAGRQLLPSLTGLRWIAASMVFAFHLGFAQYFDGAARPVFDVFAGGGRDGVTLFFVLSGFVLTWGHRPTTRASRFWMRRIARVYPLHLATVALALVVGAAWVPTIRSPDGGAVLANVLLVSAWNRAWWQAGNPVSWSLVCEAFFYLMFPLIIRLLDRRGRLVLVVTATASVVVMTFIKAIVPLMPFPASSYSTPLMRLPEFVVGVVAALLMRQAWRPPRPVVAVPIVVAVYLLSTPLVPFLADALNWNGLFAASAALLIASLARQDLDARPSPLRHPVLVWLGQVSFAFYLVHLLVLRSISSPWPGGHPHMAPLHALGLATVAFVVALSLAALLHHFVEQPMQGALMRVADGRFLRRAPSL